MSRWPSLLQMGNHRVHTWQPRITITLITKQYGRNFFRCRTYCKWPVHDCVVSYKAWSMKGTFPPRPCVSKWTHQIAGSDLSHSAPQKCEHTPGSPSTQIKKKQSRRKRQNIYCTCCFPHTTGLAESCKYFWLEEIYVDWWSLLELWLGTTQEGIQSGRLY